MAPPSLRKPKSLTRSIRYFLGRLGGGLAFGLVIGLVTLALGETNFLKLTELISADVRYREREPVPFRSDLGYIDFDDTSIALFGKWVWPRSRQVTLIRTLDLYDARALGYDVFFTERNDIVFTPERVERALKGTSAGGTAAGGGTNAGSGANAGAIVDPVRAAFRDYDAEMEAAIASAGNVYLAQFISLPDASLAGNRAAIQQAVDEMKATFSPDRLDALSISSQYAVDADSAMEARFYKSVEVVTPLSNFGNVAAGIGYAQIIADLDKTVRMYPLFMYYDRKVYPSIAIMMLSNILQVPIANLRIIPGEYVEFPDALVPPDPGFAPPAGSAQSVRPDQPVKKTIRIPIDNHGQMLVNWAGAYYDRGLHVSYRLVATIDAWNEAKRLARAVPPEPSRLRALHDEIVFHLADEEGLVTRREAEEIAARIALARLAEPFAEPGGDRGDAGATGAATLQAALANAILPADREIFSAHLEPVSRAVAAAHAAVRGEDTAAPGLEKEWAAEIRREIAFFGARERIDAVRPLYFPAPTLVPWEGRMRAFSPVDLENRTFLAGLTGTGTIDLNPMPFDKACPMVALHITALNTILTGQHLRRASEYAEPLAVIGLAVVAGIGCFFLTPSLSFIVCTILAMGYGWWAFRSWSMDGVWIPLVKPMLGVTFVYLAEVVLEFVKAAREKQKVRGIFSTMVSPKVLKLMEDNPERFSLSGERKPATMFFSSIDGFNQVMQREAPDELAAILGLYLTPTSEIIMDYDGYIDKYEGHVIMADFGVPLDDPDHAWKCCFAAIEQQQDIESFRKFVLARYGAEVRVSMGINSGYVSAGNMGSEKKMQYTVMGDAVNVAARFRPANGIYNTGIITGEASEPVVRDHVRLRMLDRLLLKGKTKPTAIYEVMGWKADAYLAAKREKPVPDALLTRWTKCPPEKIFAYAEFWRERAADYSVAMAGEIASFFESQFETAEKIMANSAVLMIDRMRESLDRLETQIKEINGAEATAAAMETPADTPGWRVRLLGWKARIEAVIQRIEEGRAAGRTAPPGLPSLPELRLISETLRGKIVILNENLEKKPKSRIPAVARTLQVIRETLEGKGTPDAREIFDSNLATYRAAVAAFHKKIAARPAEYHEMMARIGDLTERAARVRDLFEEALKLHWDRRWDEALERLRAAAELEPEDGPVQAFIERIEGYKTTPPGAAWQGEFVQTKK
jgi:class 3 adenylate cyclase